MGDGRSLFLCYCDWAGWCFQSVLVSLCDSFTVALVCVWLFWSLNLRWSGIFLYIYGRDVMVLSPTGASSIGPIRKQMGVDANLPSDRWVVSTY